MAIGKAVQCEHISENAPKAAAVVANAFQNLYLFFLPLPIFGLASL